MRLTILLYAASLTILAETAFSQQDSPKTPPTLTKPAEDQPWRPGGPGGFGGPGGPEKKLVTQFDNNKNGRLDTAERIKARAFLKENPAPRHRFGPPRGKAGQEAAKVTPAKHISPTQVKASKGSIYSPNILRTLFIKFENDDWESELEDFYNTDVDVPATLAVDGKTYLGVGLHFRGKSSYFMARTGQKRSLNLSIDHTDPDLRLKGYKTLNLNNSFGDGSLIGAALYSQIARSLIPTPKVNLVRIVINGEDWGIYQNQQQFDKDFLKENYRFPIGARWKAPGSPNGKAGLEYLGENIEAYEKLFEMKKGTKKDWQALIGLCKILNETPAAELEKALKPILNIEGVLRFLAIDCTLMNSDGYWARASDYNIYRDSRGVFHIIPHDMNEAFRAGHGHRRPGKNKTSKPTTPFSLDPLVGLEDNSKPLRSKLLAVPALRKRYLKHVETIARYSLDWKKLGPLVASYRTLIEDEVAADTRKNGTTENFLTLTSQEIKVEKKAEAKEEEPRDHRGHRGGGTPPFRTFADERRAFLLKYFTAPATPAK